MVITKLDTKMVGPFGKWSRGDPSTESGGLGGKIHDHVMIVRGGDYCTKVNLLCIHVYHVVYIQAMLNFMLITCVMLRCLHDVLLT